MRILFDLVVDSLAVLNMHKGVCVLFGTPDEGMLATLDLLILRHVYFSLRVCCLMCRIGCRKVFSIVKYLSGSILHDWAMESLSGLLEG